MIRAMLAACIACVLPVAAQQADSSKTIVFSPLDPVNGQLPSWLRLSGEERVRLEGVENGGFKPANSDLYLLQRFRFNLNIQPASWLKVFVQTQDARVFWKNQIPAPPLQSTWDLRQAYAEFGDMDKAPATLRVGRQEIILGEERLVGPSNWTNTGRTFDAARATFRYRKLRLDAFAASVVVLADGQVGSVQAGNNLHGLYGSLTDVIPQATIEPYFLWRLQPGVKSELGPTGNSDMKVTGVRWVGKLPGHFDYNTDSVFERGGLVRDSIAAWAGHWLIGYSFPNAGWKPRVYAEYNYATGDGSPKDGQRNTFDQLYPSGHDKYGLADQVGWKNIHHLRTGLEWRMSPKWAANARYSDYWLTNAHDALYSTSNAVVARVADGSAGRWVGQELDVSSTYQFAKTTQVGAGLAHIFPGTFLQRATPGLGYTFPYVFLNTQF
jgi:hypothetical protein